MGLSLVIRRGIRTPFGGHYWALIDIVAHRGDGFQRHVAPSPDGPFIVLFEQNGADEPVDCVVVGEDSDDIGSAFDHNLATGVWPVMGLTRL